MGSPLQQRPGDGGSGCDSSNELTLRDAVHPSPALARHPSSKTSPARPGGPPTAQGGAPSAAGAAGWAQLNPQCCRVGTAEPPELQGGHG